MNGKPNIIQHQIEFPLESGTDLRYLQELPGNTNLTTEIYTHITKKVFSKLNQLTIWKCRKLLFLNATMNGKTIRIQHKWLLGKEKTLHKNKLQTSNFYLKIVALNRDRR